MAPCYNLNLKLEGLFRPGPADTGEAQERLVWGSRSPAIRNGSSQGPQPKRERRSAYGQCISTSERPSWARSGLTAAWIHLPLLVRSGDEIFL